MDPTGAYAQMMASMPMAMPTAMPTGDVPMATMMDPMAGQKRPREDGAHGASKVLATGGVQTRLLMQNQEAGTLIGPGGTHIAQIRDQSQCHVNIADTIPGQNERLVSFTGTKEQVFAALQLAIGKLEESSPTPAGEKKVFKVVVPNEQVGSIIGKGGSKAKEIREQSGAFMNISAASEIHAYSPERIVTVTGEPQHCTVALTRITDELANHPLEDRPYRGSYDTTNPMQMQQMQMQQQMQMHSPVQARPMAAAPSGAPSGPECNASFLVLNEHAGHLIGKQGSVINELRQQSGAKIDIQRAEPGQNERNVTIIGSIQQCQLAQHLISVKLATVLSQLQQFEERDRAATSYVMA